MFIFKVDDGCSNYTVLNATDRAQGNALPPNNGSDNNHLVTGWYRFQGAVGNRMPLKCVVRWRCSTNGRHPTGDNCEVTREVCYVDNWQTKCCGKRCEIKVKNCTGYYVYKLNWKTPFNNSKYCGNAGAGKLH